jgi:hypothetical protein
LFLDNGTSYKNIEFLEKGISELQVIV